LCTALEQAKTDEIWVQEVFADDQSPARLQRSPQLLKNRGCIRHLAKRVDQVRAIEGG
jgi:hypothetical protein